MKFVCEQLAKHCGDEELRHTFVNYMGGEVKQRSDAQKMEYARKLYGVFCDDYANAMGVKANEAAVWFAASMLGWMPIWFKAVVEALQEKENTKKKEKEKRQKEKEKKKKEKEEAKKAKNEAKERKKKEKKEKQEKKRKEKEEAKKAKTEKEAAAEAAGTACVGNSNSVSNHSTGDG
jgi:DNA mismatch repair ATPase MutL